MNSYIRFSFAIALGLFMGILFWNAFIALMLSFVRTGLGQIF